MSPEQITGAPISIAADLYALGVTLFEAATGRLPFLGPDFVAQHLGEPAPAASSVGADLAAGGASPRCWATKSGPRKGRRPVNAWNSVTPTA